MSPPVKTYYFIRHGETEYNRLGKVQGSGVDTSLNAQGHQQAQHFYQAYSDHHFDLVICSALRRTYETIEPFVRAGIPVLRSPEINEIGWGIHEGKRGDRATIRRYRQMIDAWGYGQLHERLPGGESAEELYQRVHRFIEHLVAMPESDVLICTHGRTLRCLMTAMKGESPDAMERYSHANTGLFVLQYASGVFCPILENNLEHLHAPQS